MKNDFSIYNLEERKEVVYEKDANDIQELYDTMLRHSSSANNATPSKKRVYSYQEQLQELKSFLSLQNQLGSLQKFRYDQGFMDVLELGKYQKIHDDYFEQNMYNPNIKSEAFE